MSEGPDFDQLAASLRADATDQAFVEALATKLEGAFPNRVEVERSGRFGGKRVRRLVIGLGDNRYELDHDGGHVSCRRRKVVGGIALKNEDLPLEEWIDHLSRALVDEADRTERGRVALERLLGAELRRSDEEPPVHLAPPLS